MTCHRLKCAPDQFDAVLSGRKRFDYRADSPPGRFQVGDELVLVEYVEADALDPDSQPRATGREVCASISYVQRVQPIGQAILSLTEIEVEA